MMTVPHDMACIDRAVQGLKNGQLVIFPTETVYGLGADASNPEALSRLYRVKQRPDTHPVIVHLADGSQLTDWATDIPELAYRLAEEFWPGPLTIILPKAAHVPAQVTGGQDTIGIRIPNHPVALELLRAFGGGLAAPSANPHTGLSPTRLEHLKWQENDDIAAVLDGGPCTVGIESTIVDLSTDTPRILRPGIITEAELAPYLLLNASHDKDIPKSKPKPRAPGDLLVHYAPSTPCVVLPTPLEPKFIAGWAASYTSVALLARDAAPTHLPSTVQWVTMANTPLQYAQELYHQLHLQDKLGHDIIGIEAVPQLDAAWQAIDDRLQRASRQQMTAQSSQSNSMSKEPSSHVTR